MKSFNFRSFLAVAAMALLAACGGSAPSDQPGFTSTASVLAYSPPPVADCEAEGCNQPRIVDGLAEQYRFGAVQQPQEQPAEPIAAAETADVLQAATSEAAPAAAVAQ